MHRHTHRSLFKSTSICSALKQLRLEVSGEVRSAGRSAIYVVALLFHLDANHVDLLRYVFSRDFSNVALVYKWL